MGRCNNIALKHGGYAAFSALAHSHLCMINETAVVSKATPELRGVRHLQLIESDSTAKLQQPCPENYVMPTSIVSQPCADCVLVPRVLGLSDLSCCFLKRTKHLDLKGVTPTKHEVALVSKSPAQSHLNSYFPGAPKPGSLNHASLMLTDPGTRAKRQIQAMRDLAIRVSRALKPMKCTGDL